VHCFTVLSGLSNGRVNDVHGSSSLIENLPEKTEENHLLYSYVEFEVLKVASKAKC
jgi:hypothetical protein